MTLLKIYDPFLNYNDNENIEIEFNEEYCKILGKFYILINYDLPTTNN